MDYDILVSSAVLKKIADYKQDLVAGRVAPGALFASVARKNFGDMRVDEFLETLLATKKPCIFAESEIIGGGADWNDAELSILGDISVAMKVEAYDNGVWNVRDPHFQQYQNPLEATLIFTAGPLLAKGNVYIPDRYEVVSQEGKIDAKAYEAMIERRIYPALKYASDAAEKEGVRALVVLPGLGAGMFAGEFRGEMAGYLDAALRRIFTHHAADLAHIGMVRFDSFNEGGDHEEHFGSMIYRVRPQVTNPGIAQLSKPADLEETGDDFSSMRLFKIVAWDHVSLPGNDFFANSRATDDGVTSAATNAMEKVTGIKGAYNARAGKYLPPAPYRDWEEVAQTHKVSLKVGNNLKVY